MKRFLLFLPALLFFAVIPAKAQFGSPTSADVCYATAVTGTTVTCGITNQPASGDVVIAMVQTYTGLTLSSVSDGTNSFTLGSGTGLTSGCATANDTSAGSNCVAYLIEPNGSGGTTFKATVTGGTCGACSITINHFPVSGGTASLDVAIGSSGTGPVSTPTFVASSTNELFWSGASVAHRITGTSGSWTPAQAIGTFGEMAAYQLSASGSQTASFSVNTSGGYDSTMIAFKGLASAPSKGAMTRTANSCSPQDVQAIVNISSAGDTVKLPPCNTSWTNADVSITVPITIQGSGIGSTIIQHNVSTGQQNWLFQFNSFASGTVRITGIDFQNLDYLHRAIACFNGNFTGYTRAAFRIDNSHFLANGTNGAGSSPAGNVDIYSCAGVIDHNTFDGTNFTEQIHNNGDGDPGWTNNVVIGGSNMLFVENNTFNTISGGFVSAVESYNGSRLVFRYNTLNSVQVDEHGTAGLVGARWWEIYSNTFNTSSSFSQDKTMDLRGGSGVVYNNTRSGPLGVNIVVREEDATTWPAAYQVGSGINGNTDGHVSCSGGTLNNSPAYFWSNGGMTVGNGAGTKTKVNVNEDYYTPGSPPSTISAEQLTTDTCSTTYTYTPYTYPHPLVTGTQQGNQQVATPLISPGPGAYTSPQTVSITDSTPSAVICYTADGSTPTSNGSGACSNGTTYSGSFSQTIAATVKAIGTLVGFTDSAIASTAYTLTATAATPVISPSAGAFTSAQTVSISCATTGSTIYYTPDGTSPTHSSIVYTGPFNEPVPGTVKAICAASGYTDSSVATAAYTTLGLQPMTGLTATAAH